MTDRAARLRQESLDRKPALSSERAELMTAFYRDAPAAPLPILRALSFQHLTAHKALCILPGELIVGERGPAPKATPTYPELCCHTLEDLDILDSREKISFAVDQRARDAYRDEVIPYWRERSMRHRMFEELPDAWKHAYEAGVFTEFMEQRAPGHTVADGKIYEKGLAGLQADIDRELAALDDLHDLDAYDKRQQLKGMRLAADAVITFARRHAGEAARLAAAERDPVRKAELEQIADICAWVPEHPARTVWEALQSYWFVHLGVITELNTWDSFCPGRLDQHLYPYYKREVEAGTLTRERAKELLQCFWVKFNNQPAPPKVGVTLGEADDRVARDRHRAQLLALVEGLRVALEVEGRLRRRDLSLEVEHALPVELAVSHRVARRPLLHELGEAARRVRVEPLLRQLAEHLVAQRAASPEGDDLPLVLADDLGGDLVLRLRTRVEDAQVFRAVAGQLGVRRHRLRRRAALADDELAVAHPEDLAIADRVEVHRAQHGDAVPAHVLPVERRGDGGALVADGRNRVEAGAAQAFGTGGHACPPMVVTRPRARNAAARLSSLRSSGGVVPLSV